MAPWVSAKSFSRLLPKSRSRKSASSIDFGKRLVNLQRETTIFSQKVSKYTCRCTLCTVSCTDQKLPRQSLYCCLLHVTAKRGKLLYCTVPCLPPSTSLCTVACKSSRLRADCLQSLHLKPREKMTHCYFGSYYTTCYTQQGTGK